MTISEDEVATAEATASAAEDLANSLEDAIRAGDITVTHEELTKQKGLVQFLRLQVEGARTKAAARRVAAHRAGELDDLLGIGTARQPSGSGSSPVAVTDTYI